MKFVHDFTKDFEALVEEKEPFAFVRFHDGECAILNGLPYRSASQWTSRGNDVWFKDELQSVLQNRLDGLFLGISPPCCAPQATEFFRRGLKLENTTFATIFQFKNYRRMRELRRKYANAVLIGSGNGVDIQVPTNGVSKEWDVDAVVDKMLSIERPFFVAAGPCANIIVYRYWSRQEPGKRQTAIDIGAAMDAEIHKRQTRPYHKAGSKTQQHVCSWSKWKPFTPLPKKPKDVRAQAQETYRQFADMPVIGSKKTVKRKVAGRRPKPLPSRFSKNK